MWSCGRITTTVHRQQGCQRGCRCFLLLPAQTCMPGAGSQCPPPPPPPAAQSYPPLAAPRSLSSSACRHQCDRSPKPGGAAAPAATAHGPGPRGHRGRHHALCLLVRAAWRRTEEGCPCKAVLLVLQRWRFAGRLALAPMHLRLHLTPPSLPARPSRLDIPLDDRGLVPFHRTAYEMVLRCVGQAELPQGGWRWHWRWLELGALGSAVAAAAHSRPYPSTSAHPNTFARSYNHAGEMKRRLDRLVRRFLARYTPSPQGEMAEHMNFQVGRGRGACRGRGPCWLRGRGPGCPGGAAEPTTCTHTAHASKRRRPRRACAACLAHLCALCPRSAPPFPRGQVAITVMRIQRHWRAMAARRKAEREAARPVVPRLRLEPSATRDRRRRRQQRLPSTACFLSVPTDCSKLNCYSDALTRPARGACTCRAAPQPPLHLFSLCGGRCLQGPHSSGSSTVQVRAAGRSCGTLKRALRVSRALGEVQRCRRGHGGVCWGPRGGGGTGVQEE